MDIEQLIREGQIRCLDELHNTAYLLEKNLPFLNSDYRIMQNQEQQGLAKCFRVSQNGKQKLIFFNEGFRTLSSLYGCMNFTALTEIIEHIFDVILTVESNGFLKSENINDSLDYIYVDPDSFRVKLHYLPVKIENKDEKTAHQNLRTSLARQIHSIPLFSGSDVQAVCELLENESYTLETVTEQLKSIRHQYQGRPQIYEEGIAPDGTKMLAANLRLISRNPELAPNFHVHTPEFVIGKSRERADGVVAKSTVSRRHCRIIWENEAYYLEDLDSTNGTKVNYERIPSRRRIRLMSGDVISVSGVDFLVEF